MRCEGSGSDEFFHLGVAAPPRSKAGVGNQGFKSFQRGFSPSAGNVGSSFILDIICKSWMLFANSEYFSLSGAGQSKSRHLFLGKIPAKKDLWGLELPRAPSRHVYPAVDVTWRKSWWIFVDFHGFELPSGVPTSLHSRTLENQILLLRFSLGNNCCRIRDKSHPGNSTDSLKILELRIQFPIQKIPYPQSAGRGRGGITLDHLSLHP